MTSEGGLSNQVDEQLVAGETYDVTYRRLLHGLREGMRTCFPRRNLHPQKPGNGSLQGRARLAEPHSAGNSLFDDLLYYPEPQDLQYLLGGFPPGVSPCKTKSLVFVLFLTIQ